MKLWEIKAQAFKLMFTDSDLQFNESEFVEKVIEQNSNTRDKYIRMHDSINRAIDIFYDYCGDYKIMADVHLVEYVVNGNGLEILNPSQENIDLYGPVSYKRELKVSHLTDLEIPKRIDLKGDYDKRIFEIQNISFYYSPLDGTIKIPDLTVEHLHFNPVFILYYQKKRQYLIGSENEITFDVSTLGIPPDVQRNIPYFMKAELFEEDEVSISMLARNFYTSFLIGRAKNFSNVQTKVTRAKVFNKSWR